MGIEASQLKYREHTKNAIDLYKSGAISKSATSERIVLAREQLARELGDESKWRGKD